MGTVISLTAYQLARAWAQGVTSEVEFTPYIGAQHAPDVRDAARLATDRQRLTFTSEPDERVEFPDECESLSGIASRFGLWHFDNESNAKYALVVELRSSFRFLYDARLGPKHGHAILIYHGGLPWKWTAWNPCAP